MFITSPIINVPYLNIQVSFTNWQIMSLKNCMKEITPAGLDLLESLLVLDPNKRISAKRALYHPYFEDLNKNSLPAGNGDNYDPITIYFNRRVTRASLC